MVGGPDIIMQGQGEDPGLLIQYGTKDPGLIWTFGAIRMFPFLTASDGG